MQGSGKRLTKEEKQAVVEAYKRGESSEAIGRRIGKSGPGIRQILRKAGVDRRGAVEAHQEVTLRTDAFDCPNEEGRYWLGLLLSDGWVLEGDNGSNDRLGISLTAPDGEYLHLFSEFLGSVRRPRLKVKKNRRNVYSWCVRSQKLVDAVAKFGIVPRKSHGAYVYDDFKHDSAFWRGMIDGDGTISRDPRIPGIGITGTEVVCEAFAKMAHKLFSKHLAVVQLNNRKSFSVSLSGEPAKAVMEYLYKFPGPAMARKKLACLDYLERFKNRTFRVFDMGEQLTASSNMPLYVPTREQASACLDELRKTDTDTFFKQSPADFRNYTGDMRAESVIYAPTKFNAISQWAAASLRYTCSHRNWRSPETVWGDANDRAKILDQSMGYEKPARLILKRKAYVASSYNVAAATALLKSVDATSVLDPCAGWGDRLAASLVCGARYTGVDPNKNMIDAYRSIVSLCAGNAEVIPSGFENAELSGVYDTVFTCPPYWDTEIYSQDTDQSSNYPTYESWRNKFYNNMMTKAWAHLQSGGTFIMTVANVDRDGVILPLIEDCLKHMKSIGGILESIYALRFRGRRGAKHSVSVSEPTFIWRKI